uniref:C2H2-type domain-containing protein n=1 Tax=Lotharella oceanica TaxID=641309 RepID=A0A7S2TJX9_9EUKA|mmetsp:Transcript_17447/g.33106  ORF Transcript_17447/g.33106 Transcript_17447/m.33106 type:complete len:436 (+) Transcript_17447:61-1368(+)
MDYLERCSPQGRRRYFDASQEHVGVNPITHWPQEELRMQKIASYGGGSSTHGTSNQYNKMTSGNGDASPMKYQEPSYPSPFQRRRQLRNLRRSRDFSPQFAGFPKGPNAPYNQDFNSKDSLGPNKEFYGPSMRHPAASSSQPGFQFASFDSQQQYFSQQRNSFNRSRRRGWSSITRMREAPGFNEMGQKPMDGFPQHNIPRLSVPAPTFQVAYSQQQPPQHPRFASVHQSARNQFSGEGKFEFSSGKSTTELKWSNPSLSGDMKSSSKFNSSFGTPNSSNIRKGMESMQIEQQAEEKITAPVVAAVKDCKPVKAVVLQQQLERSRGDGFIAFVPVTPGEVKPRKYKCLHCDKVFRQRSTVIAHVRTHTGEKPFKCSLCHRGFTQRSNLKRHEFTRHESHLNNSVASSDSGGKQQRKTTPSSNRAQASDNSKTIGR